MGHPALTDARTLVKAVRDDLDRAHRRGDMPVSRDLSHDVGRLDAALACLKRVAEETR